MKLMSECYVHWMSIYLALTHQWSSCQRRVDGGWGGFSTVVATFSHVGGSLIFYSHHWGCLNNPVFSNLGLCAVCWAHLMCSHKLWSTSVGHPFSFLNSSLGLTWGKHYQKITIAIFRFVPQNFTIPGYFFLLCYSFLWLSFILTFSWLVCYCSVWLYFSPESIIVSIIIICISIIIL